MKTDVSTFTGVCQRSADPKISYLAWSAPSGILIHTIGFGFLLGVDVYDVVLLLRTRKAVETFIRPRVTLGGEVSVGELEKS
jgi:lipid-binding SYLF domain-containing protein